MADDRHTIRTDSPAACDEPRLHREPWTRDLRLLLVIAGPNVASTVAQTLMSVVDYAIVSQLPDAPEAQAAVQSGGLLFFTLFSFLLGMMVCVTTVVSQSLGANRLRDCSAYAWQGLWICLLFGLGGAMLAPLMPGTFDLIGHAPAVRAMEADYTRIRLLSLGSAGASVAMANYFNGIHRPTVNAVTVAIATVANGLVSYCLVLGKWGCPALGVSGAAWGTVIATFLRASLLLSVMCFGRYAVQFHARHTWRIDRDKMRRLIKVGAPTGVQFVLDVAAWMVLIVVIVGRFGTKHLAASATVSRYTELSFMPAIGIGISVATLVGRSIGEGRPDLARRRARLGMLVNMAYMGLMALAFVLFGSWLMARFHRDAQIVALGAELLVLAAIFQVFDAVAITFNNALRGAGDTAWPAVVSAVQAWTLMIGGGTWVAWRYPQFGARGPWFFATLYVTAIGITLWWRWRQGKWQHLDVIGRKEPPVGSPIR